MAGKRKKKTKGGEWLDFAPAMLKRGGEEEGEKGCGVLYHSYFRRPLIKKGGVSR